MRKVVCKNCKKIFFTYHKLPRGVYCSKKCFLEKRSEVQKELWKDDKYREHMVKVHTGKKQSKESIEKRRQALKGRVSPNLGNHWKMTDEQRLNQSKSVLSGKAHPNYIDGRTPINKIIRRSVEFKLWREAVFARDDYTCQKCNQRGNILHPHHIFNFADFPDLRFEVDNGITFCEKCHRLFHKRFGYKNNEKQLQEFLLKDI